MLILQHLFNLRIGIAFCWRLKRFKFMSIIDARSNSLLDLMFEHDSRCRDIVLLQRGFERQISSRSPSKGIRGSLVHEKGARDNSFNSAAKVLNHIKPEIRACVEHAFGGMSMTVSGKLTRKIGLDRTEAGWVIWNLTYQFLRYLRRNTRLTRIG